VINQRKQCASFHACVLLSDGSRWHTVKIFCKKPLHVWFGAALLLCFALAKLLTIFARRFGFLPHLLQSQVSDERLMFYAGIGELAAVFLILYVLNVKSSCQLIALIGASFLIYRYVMFDMPCPCMGAAPALVPWLKINERIILLTVPIIWLLTGLWGWARAAHATPKQL
jgi:hypothetical protein